jgi:hypothetical protein
MSATLNRANKVVCVIMKNTEDKIERWRLRYQEMQMSAYGEVWWKSGVRRSGLCRYVWQESGFSLREDVFTFNLLHKEIL